MANWLDAKVTNITWWNDTLFSINVTAPLPTYKAGQFTKLAMIIKDKKVARAYSFVNAPNLVNDHEFLLVTVKDGLLSPPISKLNVGDSLLIAENATGFFTLDDVPKAKQLWLLATGTAIGPYLSILNDGEVWQKFERVFLVHGVRKQEDLVYQESITRLCDNHPLTFIPVISRETNHDYLTGRITTALESNELFNRLNITATPEHAQFMLCGNPDMVKDCTEILLTKGFTRNRRANPGQITVEQYW